MADFLANNANIYATEGTYVENPTIENVYNDIINLGMIFGVTDKAETLVSELRSRQENITSKLQGITDITVFNLDTNMGDGTMYTVGGANLLDYLISEAGGENIFGNLGASYSRISLEEIISLNPEFVIVTKYYTEIDASDKIDYLKKTPELSEVTAITEENIVIISGIYLRPGLQTLNALEAIAKALHPELFN